VIAREERRLRALFLSLASAGSLGTGVYACSTAETHGAPDASAGGSQDATVDVGTAEASSDAGPITDSASSAACGPVFLDGADDGNGCEYFEGLACGLPPDSSSLDCNLILSECADLCGSQFGYPCLVVGCQDGAVPSGALVLECTTGKVSCPDGGRRPAGLVEARAVATSAAGAWLAELAWLEEASVHAFRCLATELAAMGAPRPLVRCALRAVRDEMRHARVVTRLARRRGATPARAHVKRARARSLAAFALENAVEGCVRESYGALVATWQATHAPDADVARAMARVAADETRHAALAWSISRWLHARLDDATRARVSSAMRGALASLRCEVRATDAATARALGLPDGKTGATLVDGFARALAIA